VVWVLGRARCTPWGGAPLMPRNRSVR
jgi:hypothetical protein